MDEEGEGGNEVKKDTNHFQCLGYTIADNGH